LLRPTAHAELEINKPTRIDERKVFIDEVVLLVIRFSVSESPVEESRGLDTLMLRSNMLGFTHPFKLKTDFLKRRSF
tara:strand:- start:303 stop:533 length:231 start_codon:yes stop_codon:yes gene_type:complete